jgi:hypothetical protein
VDCGLPRHPSSIYAGPVETKQPGQIKFNQPSGLARATIILVSIKAIKGRSHLLRSPESGLGADKSFDGTDIVDKMQVNEQERSGWMWRVWLYGKCR